VRVVSTDAALDVTSKIFVDAGPADRKGHAGPRRTATTAQAAISPVPARPDIGWFIWSVLSMTPLAGTRKEKDVIRSSRIDQQRLRTAAHMQK
jgi:hypothetical protein